MYKRDQKFQKLYDITPYEDGEETLKEKVLALRGLSKAAIGTEICPDIGATNTFKDYTLKVSIPGTRGNASMVFTDGNGEFVQQDNNSTHKAMLKEKIATYDIILIAIDTPFLMEAKNRANRLCQESTNKKFNQIPALQTILTEVDDGEGKLPNR